METDYDAWGAPRIFSYGSMVDRNFRVAALFYYRGYIFDLETNLYYLQSRYYDADIGRFINSDTIDVLIATPMALTDKNLYAYCDNNPVMRADYGGELWNLIIGVGVGALVGATVSVVSQLLDEEGAPINSGAFWGHVGIAGYIGGNGSASKHVRNSFWRTVGNGNWSYYFSQTNRQAVKDGLKAIPSILKATAPTISKSLIKTGFQYWGG